MSLGGLCCSVRGLTPTHPSLSRDLWQVFPLSAPCGAMSGRGPQRAPSQELAFRDPHCTASCTGSGDQTEVLRRLRVGTLANIAIFNDMVVVILDGASPLFDTFFFGKVPSGCLLCKTWLGSARSGHSRRRSRRGLPPGFPLCGPPPLPLNPLASLRYAEASPSACTNRSSPTCPARTLGPSASLTTGRLLGISPQITPVLPFLKTKNSGPALPDRDVLPRSHKDKKEENP